MLTEARVKRFQDRVREARELVVQLEERVKNREALRHLSHAMTNLKLAVSAVQQAAAEGNK